MSASNGLLVQLFKLYYLLKYGKPMTDLRSLQSVRFDEDLFIPIIRLNDE
jgi:hypothetical protein